MPRFPIFAFLTCALALFPNLKAQPFPSPPLATSASSQPQTIHLDVLVKDKSGQPVHGLAAQNFTIFDKGQPQKLDSFTAVNAQDHPDGVNVLIVVDMINIGFNSVAWAREQMGEFLRQETGKLGHPTSIAVLTEDGLQMMSGSTTDGNVLQQTFQKFGTDLRAVNRSAGWEGLDEMMETSLKEFSEILAVEQTRPGRKLLLFISPGWPMLANQGSTEDLRAAQWVFNVDVRLTDTIRDARTAIYGLTPSELGREDPFYYQSFLKPVTKVTRRNTRFSASACLPPTPAAACW